MVLREYAEFFRDNFKGEGRAEMGPLKLTRIVRKLCKLQNGDHVCDLKGMKVCSCNCLSAQHLFPRVKPVLWNNCAGAIQLLPIPTLPSQGVVS